MRGLVVGLGLFVAAGVAAQEPKKDPPAAPKPQWQRMLTGEDAKKAAELEQQIDRLDAADKRGEARKVAENLLALRTQAQGPDHWQVTDARVRLADLRRDTPPEQLDQIRHAFTLNAIGVGSINRGKSAEAEAPLLEAREILRKIRGEAHPAYAITVYNLAQAHHGAGDYERAEARYREACDLFARALGESHPQYAAALNSLGVLYRLTGEYEKAQALYLRALHIRETVLGEAHPDYAQSLANLAVLWEARGDFRRAKPLALKALDLRRKILGENHRSYATSLNNLGVLHQAIGDYAGAEQLFLQALALRERNLGTAHPDYAQSVDNLAVLYLATASPAKAEPLALRALDLRRKLLGEEHPDCVQSLVNLAECYRALGADDKIEPLLARVLEYPRSVIGESHPLYTRVRGSLGLAHARVGKWAKAEPLLLEVRDVNQRLFGDVHPDSARSLYNLAAVYRDQDRYADAELLLEQAAAAAEGTRLTAAGGLERAVVTFGTPAQLLAATQALRGNTSAATATLEASLARGLLDERAARRLPALTPDEIARGDRLVTDLAKLQPRVQFLATRPKPTDAERKELDALAAARKRLDAELAALAVAVSRREVADLPTIRKALPGDAAWLCWLDLANDRERVIESWACVVRPAADPVWVQLPGTGEKGKVADADSALPGRLRAALGGDREKKLPPATVAEAADLTRKLRAQRLEPVLKHLDGVKTLYVTAVGPMAGVPVEVLAPEFTVSYTPSGTFLARLPKKDNRPPTLLAVGDAVYQAEQPRQVAAALPPHGLLITQLDPAGSLARAGLKAGDVILAFADAPTKTLDDLKGAVQKAAGAKDAAVTYWRAGADGKADEQTVHVAPAGLGLTGLHRDPAPQALADRRRGDELAARLARGDQFDDLPGTRFEVTRIAGLFDKPTVLLDGKASEPEVDALRKSGALKGFRYLHFAAHGQGNTVRALESRLVLSQDRPRETLAKPGAPLLDNAVTAREVLEFWELDADLVTLSACETAIGVKAGGEGLLGFAQAFLIKGSRAVCLSLWEVDDTATALLMARFYQNLLGKRDGLKGPMGKAAALKEAKEWLRDLSAADAERAGAALKAGVERPARGEKKAIVVGEVPKPEKAGEKPFAHPKYWAAFILVGDPN